MINPAMAMTYFVAAMTSVNGLRYNDFGSMDRFHDCRIHVLILGSDVKLPTRNEFDVDGRLLFYL